MPAKHVSGQEYAYYYNHEFDKPTFHDSMDCPHGYYKLTSDMTESAAVKSLLDDEMKKCSDCCSNFPIVCKPDSGMLIDMENGWINFSTFTVEIRKPLEEISKPVKDVLYDKGIL